MLHWCGGITYRIQNRQPEFKREYVVLSRFHAIPFPLCSKSTPGLKNATVPLLLPHLCHEATPSINGSQVTPSRMTSQINSAAPWGKAIVRNTALPRLRRTTVLQEFPSTGRGRLAQHLDQRLRHGSQAKVPRSSMGLRYLCLLSP